MTSKTNAAAAPAVAKIAPVVSGTAPCMIVFCAFEQLHEVIVQGEKRGGFKHYIPLIFRKNFSPQVLKANMRVVGNAEYGLILYRDRLPKFNNHGAMIFNVMDWTRDLGAPKVHPTQKPIPLLERLIEIFTDPGDVVIDPVAGSGSTLIAAENLGRRSFGFEIKKEYVAAFESDMATHITAPLPLWDLEVSA